MNVKIVQIIVGVYCDGKNNTRRHLSSQNLEDKWGKISNIISWKEERTRSYE